VHVVHVAPRFPSALTRSFSGLDERKLRDRLGGVLDQLRDAGVTARAHLERGGVVQALTKKARALTADLVIVGTRGRSVPDTLTGSTAERVVAVDQHRVLVSRRPARRPYKAVVIAADGQSNLQKQVEAARLFSLEPPSILHVYEALFETSLWLHGVPSSQISKYRAAARAEALTRMKQLVAGVGIEGVKLVLRHGSARQVLQRVDRDSLLVLGRGDSVVRRLLLGSVTRAVVAHGASDLLLV
jgi:nucleotide-binding universal stress UspA family protein